MPALSRLAAENEATPLAAARPGGADSVAPPGLAVSVNAMVEVAVSTRFPKESSIATCGGPESPAPAVDTIGWVEKRNREGAAAVICGVSATLPTPLAGSVTVTVGMP